MALTITALVRVAGLHRWATAHDERAYLRNPHRHLFHVRATVAVGHDDRDVEFHDLGRYIAIALDDLAPSLDWTLRDFGTSSCETIATHVAAHLQNHYQLSVLSVSCSEDDEYTATWTKD